jgi:hypothetical protein
MLTLVTKPIGRRGRRGGKTFSFPPVYFFAAASCVKVPLAIVEGAALRAGWASVDRLGQGGTGLRGSDGLKRGGLSWVVFAKSGRRSSVAEKKKTVSQTKKTRSAIDVTRPNSAHTRASVCVGFSLLR